MLSTGSFWKDEKEAPLLDQNFGFVKENEQLTEEQKRQQQEITDRIKSWPSILNIKTNVEENQAERKKILEEMNKIEIPRIAVADAERTFFGKAQREVFTKFIAYLHHKLGDYHQGLGYVAGFLSLFLDEVTAVQMIEIINSSDKFIPGYWKHEAVGFATDAYVFEHIMKKHFPDVAHHLQISSILPETYCQKWFVGLCVHILPYECLLVFLEKFFERGFTFLFQFGLSVIEHIQPQILSTKSTDVSRLYALLRLDTEVLLGIVPKAKKKGDATKTKEEKAKEEAEEYEKRLNFFNSILAKSDNYDVSEYDFKNLRKELYDLKLRARMEAAERQRKEAEEKAKRKAEAGDEDDSDGIHDSDFDEDEEAEEGDECQHCHNLVPEVYCNDCSLYLCELCHSKNRGGHNKQSHKTISPAAKKKESQ